MGNQAPPVPLSEVVSPPLQFLSGFVRQSHFGRVFLSFLQGLAEASLEVSVVQWGHRDGLCGCIHFPHDAGQYEGRHCVRTQDSACLGPDFLDFLSRQF